MSTTDYGICDMAHVSLCIVYCVLCIVYVSVARYMSHVGLVIVVCRFEFVV